MESFREDGVEVKIGAEPAAKNPTISADIAASFTYASYQNAVPVVRSIVIENLTGSHFSHCLVELSSSPAFLRPKSWAVDRLAPGDSLSLSDRKVELDAAYLAGLNEAERGDITLRMSVDGEIVDERHFPVRLLARDEWGGVSDMVQLLPAFVMPNDPAIARILRAAAERLVAAGHGGGLDGYQSEDPQRAFLISAAIYSAIAGLGLHYAEPPASFETQGQKIRRPSTIEEDRLATCLDISLLFAGAIEAAGLHPALLIFHDHAATGVWLRKRTFANAIETDPMEVRKALASHELMIFETTGVTHRPAMAIEAAQRALDRRMSEEEAKHFEAAIDVRRSRSGGIVPLASHQPLRRAPSDDGDPIAASPSDLSLPEAPSFAELPADAVEQKPTTAAGRIDRWQKKLLDLTLKNRLINLAANKKTIPFLCTDVAYLEDRLANGGAIRVISLPEQNPLGERDEALYREVHGRDIQLGFAAEALQRDELPSPLDARQLEARLIDLHRQVRNDFAEGGANTLFLAVGFLRWKKKPEDERSYRAPLLLVPVKLERRSASSSFTLRYHEDEPRFNATLLQFLEREFDLKLPQFHGDLPLDDSGIDVPQVLDLVRRAVRDVPGMEVLNETALSTFSFAKFLMWKDLVERTDALRQNRMVRHLIDTPDQPFAGSDATFRDEAELDSAYAPADIISLLPSDSSQTAASLAAAEGRDFVIVGPPGTGKSQTIANMIANCLAVGKTVLFVAEKTAALDVVYRRLREHGLGDQCIELHSNKADRRRFLTQLKIAWERGCRTDASEWVQINERLKLRRDALNAYVAALHARHPNGWTAYLALGIALEGSERAAPTLGWQGSDAHDVDTLAAIEELAGEVGKVFASVERQPALHLIDCEEWSSAWQADALGAAASLKNAAALLATALAAFRSCLGLADPDQSVPEDREGLVSLARALEDARGHDVAIAFDPDFAARSRQVDSLAAAINAYRSAEAGLAAGYDPRAVRDIDVTALDGQWREVNASMWPMSALGRRRVTRLLQSYASAGVAVPAQDIAQLRLLQEQLTLIDATPLGGTSLPVQGLDTDTAALKEIIERAVAIRAALATPFRGSGDLATIAAGVTASMRQGDDDDALHRAAAKLVAADQGYASAGHHFVGRAGCDLPSADMRNPGALADRLDELLGAQHLLRDWSAWRRVRARAVASGLGSLVDGIEDGSIPAGEAAAAFRLGYARWWLPAVLDADAVLRDFRRFQHEHVIDEFREFDDLARAHAARRVIDAIAHGLPSVQSVPRNSELGLLRHQMELQRPSQSIRDMIGKMPESFSRLAPCMLMSPLSIAQYFPANQALFDVVIFDEASQITTWDAVGAIARGRQTIIVGDPKQLPPTNFFGRNEDDDGIEDHEKDLESILDEAKASGVPVRDLRWHYRSRSESLIAFSNHHYYQNRLVTFPSPFVDDRAVRLHKVPEGVYDRGKSRTNRIEAEVVVGEAVKRLTGWLALPEKSRPTLGIITFNAQQQSLIMDLLDAARRHNPELEWFFADDRVEPAIVKNLENVQGDERDLILFSITFWKDAAGKLPMDFGALNRDGGERRLNVAVTRARQELIVFSGFTADQIDPARAKALGAHHLKAFLDYADRGAIALPAQDTGSLGDFESPFEQAVAERLEQRGWMVVPQVGISGFRIDLGVRHPDLAGAYLAGVECDGATYHSAATARDRDKVREQVLTGLGWNIRRVWSTDWWFDPQGCADRLHADLEALLQADREQREAKAGDPIEPDVSTHWDMGHEIEGTEDLADEGGDAVDEAPIPVALVAERELVTAVSAPARSDTDSSATPASGADHALYGITDLSHCAASPERFYEYGYRETLRQMIEAVMECESPLRTDILCQRIARVHGWLRTGGKIRERIDLHLRDYDRTPESSGEFIWKQGAVTDLLYYRAPETEDGRRAIGDIPLAELAWIVVENPGLFEEPDPARELARFLGVERLAAASRARLDEAIEKARTRIAVREQD